MSKTARFRDLNIVTDMQTVSSIKDLRRTIADWRRAGETIAFVPTMGNLHEGHLELVRQAEQKADRVVVSIFVNPTQFGPHEDFDRYPRTEVEDGKKLAAIKADLLFLPSVEEIYPEPSQTYISVPVLSSRLCGNNRPGHFDGVALVVCKLLNIIQPDALMLGEKDFQQLTIIRRMVFDLNLPVSIHSVATHREPDGLAMSSRNGYLNQEQRRLAPMLFEALCNVRDAIATGNADYTKLTQSAIKKLTDAGFDVDYFDICRSSDLTLATTDDKDVAILVAARLGSTRLIDNIIS